MAQLFVKVNELIYNFDTDGFISNILNIESKIKKYYSRDLKQNGFRAPKQIENSGIYVSTHSSNEKKRKELISLFEILEIDEELIISGVYSRNNEIIDELL